MSSCGSCPVSLGVLHNASVTPTPVANLQVKVVERVGGERAYERRRSGARARIRAARAVAHAREARPDRTVSASRARREGASTLNLSLRF